MMKFNWKLILLLFAGLLIRLLLVPQPGYEGDIVFWKTWSLAAVDHGIVWMASNTTFNYPAGYGIILWLIGHIYSLFADIHNGNVFGQPTNYFFLLLAKMPSIIADLITAGVIYSITRKINNIKKQKSISSHFSLFTFDFSLILSAIYLFHPVVLYDGSWWGQVDSIGVAAALGAVYLLILKRPQLATVILLIGFMLKLQVMILLPLFFLFIWLNYSWKKMIECLGWATLTFLLMSTPFLISGNLSKTYDLVALNSDYFPLLSLRADNFWNLVSFGNGIFTSDKILTIGIINAKTLGLIFFSGVYLLCVGLIVQSKFTKLTRLNIFSLSFRDTPRNLEKHLERRRGRLDFSPMGKPGFAITKETDLDLQNDSQLKNSNDSLINLLLAFTLASLAFYLWPTQIHERYSFPVVVLGLVCLPFIIERVKSNTGKLVALSTYLIFSLNALVSYNNSLLISYPVNGWNIGWLYQPTIAAIINLLIFITLIIFLLKNLPKLWLTGCLTIIFGGIIFLNLSFFFKNSLPLTSLKPTNVQFQYKYPEFNLSLNSYQGPKAWSFLSDRYYFYRQGISTNANTVISYNLSGRFSKFTTDYGIDTDAGDKASAGFEIWADNTKIFNSEKMGKNDLPRHIEVSVVNAKNLTLIVNDAGDGNTDDHGDWLEPTLYK